MLAQLNSIHKIQHGSWFSLVNSLTVVKVLLSLPELVEAFSYILTFHRRNPWSKEIILRPWPNRTSHVRQTTPSIWLKFNTPPKCRYWPPTVANKLRSLLTVKFLGGGQHFIQTAVNFVLYCWTAKVIRHKHPHYKSIELDECVKIELVLNCSTFMTCTFQRAKFQ